MMYTHIPKDFLRRPHIRADLDKLIRLNIRKSYF